jgi:hypothetical protein
MWNHQVTEGNTEYVFSDIIKHQITLAQVACDREQEVCVSSSEYINFHSVNGQLKILMCYHYSTGNIAWPALLSEILSCPYLSPVPGGREVTRGILSASSYSTYDTS